MELELHQLDLRYEDLRKHDLRREHHLLASLAQSGQQMPIVYIKKDHHFVVIDGYKRVRALRRLRQDTVRGTPWDLHEAEALLLDRLMRNGGADALEEGWLLLELRQHFGLTCEELARRFDRDKSWVSRRLSLVQELPDSIQSHVRSGTLAAHAAMRYLVPLARTNAEAATRLANGIVPLKLTTRQIGHLYTGWQSGTPPTRELILTTPQVYLRALEQPPATAPSQSQQFLNDLGAMSGIARRARRRLEQGLWQQLLSPDREAICRHTAQARAEANRLFTRVDLENGHAG